MCATCGCGGSEHSEGHSEEHEHVGPDGRVFWHRHRDGQGHDHDHHREPAPFRSLLPPPRVLRIEEDILEKNNALARANRARFEKAGTFVVNLMSSPGSGKTTLLVRTLEALGSRFERAVIEGDQQTTLDADRIRKTDVPAQQINTGKGCHLDAGMVARSLDVQAPPRGVLFIENVGNLVCPAGFDLGEVKRVVVVSVTEGEDKPLKYPDMFASADLVLINKIDLLPHLHFDVGALERHCQRMNADVSIVRVSAVTGEGFEPWLGWVKDGVRLAEEVAPK